MREFGGTDFTQRIANEHQLIAASRSRYGGLAQRLHGRAVVAHPATPRRRRIKRDKRRRRARRRRWRTDQQCGNNCHGGGAKKAQQERARAVAATGLAVSEPRDG